MESLPTRAIADALGRDEVFCAVGVRTGANAKATLQLVDANGASLGYAKLGWSSATDEYVRTEATTLSALTERHAARAPRVLASFEYAGRPVLVTAPLPPDVRAVRGSVEPPSAMELATLCPIVRTGQPNTTSQLNAVRDRLHKLDGPLVAEPIGRALRLLDTVTASEEPVPVTARWHGDLTPWNCARDGDGILWVWDWESSETDAIAGLDALHWAYSQRREHVDDVGTITMGECVAAAAGHLAAFGVPTTQYRNVARVYVATVIERACALAAASGGWDRVWVNDRQLSVLARQAE